MPEAGLEPAGPCEHRILSAARLPISPLRQTPDPILACSREPEKRLRSCPLAGQARNGGRVVDPRQQEARFTPGIAEHPVRATRPRCSFRDRTVDSNQSEQAGPEPIDEWSTGRYQRDIQTFIDVAWILPGMVAIHVHNDGSVAIKLPSPSCSSSSTYCLVDTPRCCSHRAWCRLNATQLLVDRFSHPQPVNLGGTPWPIEQAR